MSFQIVLEELEELFNQEKFLVAYLRDEYVGERLRLALDQNLDDCVMVVSQTPTTKQSSLGNSLEGLCFYVSGIIPETIERLKAWDPLVMRVACSVFNSEEMEKLLILIRKIFILHKIEVMKNDQ